jgi:hypothetical protein
MRIRRLPPLLLVLALAACGGGGDPTSDASVDARADVAADAGTDASPEALPEVSDVAEPTPDGTPEDVAPTDTLPPRVCRAGTHWTPGTKAFSDVTASSSLFTLGVTGVRVTAVDWDHDGDPDLVVRNTDQVRDDFSKHGAERKTWLLRNDGNWTFSDVTEQSGFTATRDGQQGRITHIVIFGDVDDDGDLDAFSGAYVEPDPAKADHGDRNEILLNDGDGTFTLATGGDLRLADERVASMGAAFTDVDRDGKLDLWLGTGTGFYEAAPDRLFQGDGAGSFADVSTALGVVTYPWMSLAQLNKAKGHHDSWGATACDLNGDGSPDLLGSSYGRYFNALWLHDADAYKLWSIESGYGADQRTDWTTNLNAQCYCKLNPTAEDCDHCPAPPAYFGCSAGQTLRWDHDYDREPFRLAGNSFTTACGDVDNDGDLDLMTFTIVHWDVGDTSDPSELLYNDGTAVFTRPGGEVTGLVRDWGRVDWNAGDMSGGFLDFDNDARLDVYIGSSDYPGTRGFLFHQKPDGTFEEVPTDVGLNHPRSHGFGLADFDGDGDLDVVLGHGRARCDASDTSCYPTQEVHAFQNELGQDGNWLRLELEGGPGTNRAAIGARVRVTAGGVTQTQEVGGGYGHVGIQGDLTLHFGLGAACDVDRLEIRWPDQALTTQVFDGVRGNYRLHLTQGGELTYE